MHVASIIRLCFHARAVGWHSSNVWLRFAQLLFSKIVVKRKKDVEIFVSLLD